MRALVFANGDPPSAALVEELHGRGDLIIAADGGARHALACDLVPDAVVGDLDSVDAAIRTAIPADNFHRVSELDTTDLEKAVAWAIERGCDEVEILGAGYGLFACLFFWHESVRTAKRLLWSSLLYLPLLLGVLTFDYLRIHGE